ncbi:MAG TPA: DNA primase, partial [Acidimicrobiaceae bacterium]|nr:DNA primase [Acidimicrobiaceae bacterium]
PDVADVFRDRVMFPIRDATGAMVGFGGRQMPGGRDPKYRNSSQTPVYDKSRVLYGLHAAKRAISTHGFVLVCEGYTDVVGFSIAGFDNAVATCGTAMTEEHVKLLTRSTRRFVVAFDADSAGQAATERLHQWERTHKLDVTVVELGEGQDPGQLAVDDPDELRQRVERARPFFAYLAERVLGRHEVGDSATPVRRDRAADELADVFAVYSADTVADADLTAAAGAL